MLMLAVKRALKYHVVSYRIVSYRIVAHRRGRTRRKWRSFHLGRSSRCCRCPFCRISCRSRRRQSPCSPASFARSVCRVTREWHCTHRPKGTCSCSLLNNSSATRGRRRDVAIVTLLLRHRHGSAEYCDERVCLCVCVCVCLSAITSPELHIRSSPNFCACYLWPWLGLPLAA